MFAAQADSIHDPWPVVGQNDVAFGSKVLDDLATRIALQVYGQRSFTSVAVGKQRRESSLGRTQVSHRVTEFERFHLDDFGTLICQHHRRKRRSDHGGEFKYADSIERFHVRTLFEMPLRNWRSEPQRP